MKKKILTLLSITLLLTSFGTTTLNAAGKQSKPFLILGKLPHLTGMVKILWDDEDLALSKEQKTKLIEVRKYTMTNAKALGKEINALEAEIVKRSDAGNKPADLQKSVSKLASLRAKATMVHLDCIYNTREILSKDQLYILE
jgi:hypothetical protein